LQELTGLKDIDGPTVPRNIGDSGSIGSAAVTFFSVSVLALHGRTKIRLTSSLSLPTWSEGGCSVSFPTALLFSFGAWMFAMVVMIRNFSCLLRDHKPGCRRAFKHDHIHELGYNEDRFCEILQFYGLKSHKAFCAISGIGQPCIIHLNIVGARTPKVKYNTPSRTRCDKHS
jgi:hypothetical protein